jgi:hypothetical protein
VLNRRGSRPIAARSSDAGGAARHREEVEQWNGGNLVIVTRLRLSATAIRRMDELAGNDKGGRSGLIRQVVGEFPGRHGDETA